MENSNSNQNNDNIPKNENISKTEKPETEKPETEKPDEPTPPSFSSDDAKLEEKSKNKKGEDVTVKREILEWVYAIVFAIVITMIIKCFIFDIVRVDGHSMDTTLANNDRLILWELGYTPKFQDIIVLDANYKARMNYIDSSKKSGQMSNFSAFMTTVTPPQGYKKIHYVKRVIGLPGDTIDIKNNKVYVNGKAINEPYLDKGIDIETNGMNVPAKVPQGFIFVMGDNRPRSLDSRSSELGFVPIKAVLGKAVFRIWPITSVGTLRH